MFNKKHLRHLTIIATVCRYGSKLSLLFVGLNLFLILCNLDNKAEMIKYLERGTGEAGLAFIGWGAYLLIMLLININNNLEKLTNQSQIENNIQTNANDKSIQV